MTARLSAAQFNASVEHPTVRVALRYLAWKNVRFRSTSFIEAIGASGKFPLVSVGQLIAAANACGVPLRGLHLDADELRTIAMPFLAYLKMPGAESDRTYLVPILRFGRSRVIMSEEGFAVHAMKLSEFISRWTGIVLVSDDQARQTRTQSDVDKYRNDVRVLPDFLSKDHCQALIDYCEASCFRRSRVAKRTGEGLVDQVSARDRSSSSVVLPDRSHPVIRPIYQHCAALEQIDERDIENIQCVRYKRNQKYFPHFDGGVGIPRTMTYLLYLNEDFEGGETYFPVLDLKIRPATGSCLRFASCDKSGRIMWQSEHGGLPVSVGTKYALNIWIRRPTEVPTAVRAAMSDIR